MTANLFVSKQRLREVEGFIRDALLAAQDPTAEIPPEEYHAMAKDLESDAVIIRSIIKELEAKLAQTISQENPG